MLSVECLQGKQVADRCHAINGKKKKKNINVNLTMGGGLFRKYVFQKN